MLKKEEEEKIANELKVELEKSVKPGLLYKTKNGRVVFIVTKLDYAIYPHIEMTILNDNMQKSGAAIFTKQDYVGNELLKYSNGELIQNGAYSLDDIPNIVKDLAITLDKEFYLNEEENLKSALENLTKIIEENNIR